MIKTLIFDFGDVLINLDKPATARALQEFGLREITPDLDQLFKDYEQGLVTSNDFMSTLEAKFPQASKEEIESAWNSILLDFPEERLNFIENLKKEGDYQLMLLSNTNEIHIQYVLQQMGKARFQRFRQVFEPFYLSYEIKLRKPNLDIFEYVLAENRLKPEQTLFIDDSKDNTDAAAQLGINTWNLLVGQEDVLSLKSRL
ncbi:MAG: HAD family phosphatase [Croceitalea sp.]|nr:HAD family phosphatase [Croceitalea sp.]MBT8239562.1 HAD family phosphatase [Croceitalea sp.]NNC33917.1 HAD family phosphatase [Croceitalea sp.]NNL08593.1 HAD family phosphatase [Croceitalea sp.]NNM17881.1 HAD family phosphatase [Croceitalea sp.]